MSHASPTLGRREFLSRSAAALAASCAVTGLSLAPAAEQINEAGATGEPVSFFLIGDTHYFAQKDAPGELDPASRLATSRLVDTLNRLPGSEIPAAAGGSRVAASPRGLIHAGDIIDSGDKSGPKMLEAQTREFRGFTEDFGLNGRDGRLKMPVYEVHGNHDGPRGEGVVLDGIKARNKHRPGLTSVSENGLHYAWDWGPVHFISLGIVVGGGPSTRHGRYNPLDSLPFLIAELKAASGKPIVITHHVDMARYSGACEADAKSDGSEWHPCDVRGFHEALSGHNIVAILYGHTHVRNVFKWNGSRDQKAEAGVPVFNTDNSAHYHSKTQALMYFEIGGKELVARECATTDGWETGAWTPETWRTKVG